MSGVGGVGGGWGGVVGGGGGGGVSGVGGGGGGAVITGGDKAWPAVKINRALCVSHFNGNYPVCSQG